MTRQAEFEFRLDPASGVPVYRQIIDQILAAIATGGLSGGDRLPTVRQVAVELAINPNTVMRAYRELEIRNVLTTQQGIGTFVTRKPVEVSEAERQGRLSRLVGEFLARGGSEGFSAVEILERLQEVLSGQDAGRQR
jgi:GntR family transcriptional regulator